MNNIKLLPWQKELYNDYKKGDKQIYRTCTKKRSGKTTLLEYIVEQELKNGKKICVLLERKIDKKEYKGSDIENKVDFVWEHLDLENNYDLIIVEYKYSQIYKKISKIIENLNKYPKTKLVILRGMKYMPFFAVIDKDPNSDYGVMFPDFLGCVTAGTTIDEATEMAAEALQFHIDGVYEDRPNARGFRRATLEKVKERYPNAYKIIEVYAQTRHNFD